jgi:hypothetical protein
MEGMARAAKREHELSISAAWHTAVFALSGYGGKLKGLSEYLGKPKRPVQHAEAIAFFHSLKERGFPVEINRVVH